MKKRRGFTLIELLTVIILLGVLMLIAIPSITSYIAKSRKKTYVGTANRYVDGVANKVNSLEYEFTDTDTTYYVPIECIPLERGGKSPFGEWVEAYVVVEFTGEKHNYYWVSYDKATMGVKLTEISQLTYDMIIPRTDSINKIGINEDKKIGIIDKDTCSATPVISDANIEEEIPLEPAREGCFAFNPSTKTITKYYEYEDNNSSNPPCPKEVKIPDQINGVDVEVLYNSTSTANGVFYQSDITKVVLPSTLKTIGGYAFYQNKLSGILMIPKSVTTIGNNAFSGDSNSTTNILTGVFFESGSQLTSIGNYAFTDNLLDGTIIIPKLVETIGNYAFAGTTGGTCGSTKTNKLTGLEFEGGSVLKTIGSNAFNYNRLTGELKIPSSTLSIGSTSFRCNNLTSVILSFGSKLTKIEEYAFYNNRLSGSLTIPKTVTSIGQYAFYSSGTSNLLTSIIFESESQLQSIGTYAFHKNNLSDIIIPKSVTSISANAFYQNKLRSINFESNSQLKTIGTNAFSWNSGGISNLTIPNSVTSIGTSAFYVTNITTLQFESGSQLKTIGDTAFGSSSVKGIVTIPKSVTSIGTRAFADAVYITDITFENGSQLQTIGDSAFYKNKANEIVIPDKVTSIGTNAFYQASKSLTSIINTTGKEFTWCDTNTGIVEVANCSPTGLFETGTLVITGSYARSISITAP